MPNIGAVILAAGESSRFGRTKQVIEFRGKTLLRRVVDAASEAGCAPIAVVLGSTREEVACELEQTNAVAIENRNWRSGIGSSIRAGVQSLIDNNSQLEAVVLLVCDQPYVDRDVIKQLLVLRRKTIKPIVASSYADTLGVPALFDRSCFEELLALNDSNGAKPIILRDRERVAEFSFPEGKTDIDTLEDFNLAKQSESR